MTHDQMVMSFGKRLRSARLARGMTQGDLSRITGLRVETISRIERGTRKNPQSITIALLADALETSADELVGSDQVPNDPDGVAESFFATPFGATLTERQRQHFSQIMRTFAGKPSEHTLKMIALLVAEQPKQ